MSAIFVPFASQHLASPSGEKLPTYASQTGVDIFCPHALKQCAANATPTPAAALVRTEVTNSNLHEAQQMSDQIFYERKTIDFVINLIRNRPNVLQGAVDLGEVLQALHWRLSPQAQAKLLLRFGRLPKASSAAIQDLSDCLIGGESCVSTKGKKFLQLNLRSVASILINAFDLLRTAPDSAKQSRLFSKIFDAKEAANHGARRQGILINFSASSSGPHSPDQTGSGFMFRISDVKRTLNLSDRDVDLLMLIFLYRQNLGIFADAFKEDRLWDLKYFPTTVAAFLGIQELEAQQILKGDRLLFKLRLLTQKGLNHSFDLNCDLQNFLAGGTETSSFTESLFEVIKNNTCNHRPLNVKVDDWRLTRAILDAPGSANLLFYGEPGTGKTTLAKSLCADLGRDIIAVKSSESGDQDARISNLLCAIKVAEHSGGSCIVLVDEADQLLCTGRSWVFYGNKIDKGWLNKTLESSAAKVVWITNSTDGIESSTLRRFAYSLEFKGYTTKQRREMWQSVLKEVPDVADSLRDSDVAELSVRYDLQPAHIVDSLRHVARLGLPQGEQRSAIESCLASYERRLHGGKARRRKDWSKANGPVSIEGLSADQDLSQVIQTLHSFSDRLINEGERLPVRNMNLLLSGPPGTGKTEFAKLVARSLGVELIFKTASDLQSCWVGETEKKIASAFAEAEESHAVLFIDEADSFLWPRGRAQQSWQVSEVNEFLCRMESFRGILICASNHIDLFDDAAVRRFNLKVRFDWLRPKGKHIFFERVLGSLFAETGGVNLSEGQRRRLDSIPNLAPGDFKVVYQRHAVLPGGAATIDQLIDDLEREVKYKQGSTGRSIGFAHR